jgi:hypothetical protein
MGYSTVYRVWLVRPFFEFREVVSVYLSILLLHFEQVGLLPFVIDLSLTISCSVLLQQFLDLFLLLLETDDSTFKIVVDVRFDDLVLPLLHFLHSFYLLDVAIYLGISQCYCIFQLFDLKVSLVLFVFALQPQDGSLVHFDLTISVLKFPSYAS